MKMVTKEISFEIELQELEEKEWLAVMELIGSLRTDHVIQCVGDEKQKILSSLFNKLFDLKKSKGL